MCLVLVETTTRQNLLLEVGNIAETVSVVAESTQINTTDASLGNALSRDQIRNLPIEAQNVVQLLSLQAGRGLHSEDAVPGGRGRGGPAVPSCERCAGRSAERDARRHRRQRRAESDGVYVSGAHHAGSARRNSVSAPSTYNADMGHQRPAGLAHHPERHQPIRRLRLLDVPSHRDVEQRVLPEIVAARLRAAITSPKLDKDIVGGFSADRFKATGSSSLPTWRACASTARRRSFGQCLRIRSVMAS